MSDDWSRVSRASSVFGGYRYKAEPQTASKTPSNNSIIAAEAHRDILKANSSDDGGSMLLRRDGPGKSNAVNALVQNMQASTSPYVKSTSNLDASITAGGVKGNIDSEVGRNFNLAALAQLQGFSTSSRNQNRASSVSDFTLPIEDISKQIGNPGKLSAQDGSHGASSMHNSALLQPNSPCGRSAHHDYTTHGGFNTYQGYTTTGNYPVYGRSNLYPRSRKEETEDIAQAIAMSQGTASIGNTAPGGSPPYIGYPMFAPSPPIPPLQNSLAAADDDDKKQQSNFQRATAETEPEPCRSRPASVEGSDGGWGAVKSSNHGWGPEDCDCADCLSLSENEPWASPVLNAKTTKDPVGWERRTNVGWGSPAPRRDGWSAASVSRDGNSGGCGTKSPQEERLVSTPAPKNSPAEDGRSTKCVCPGWCNCGRERNAMLQSHKKYSPWGWSASDDDTVSVASEGFTRTFHSPSKSECSEDAVLRLRGPINRGGNSKLDNGCPTANTTSARPAYAYADVLGGARAVHNAINNPKRYLSQQPAAGNQDALANHQATVANYEAYIRELQGQLQTRDRDLNFQEQMLARYPPNLNAREDVASAAANKESLVSTGANTGLRKEADFLRQRLAFGSLSTEDRAKAIDIISLIEGKPFEEPLVKSTSKAGTVKSTSFNISSNGHENGATNLTLDLKMHDLTKSITKMKAFDKF